MSRYIDAERIKLLMKQDRLLQGNCEYQLWKQEVDRQVNALPYIELDDYVPREFHDKTCEDMARRHQAEIAELTADRPQGWIPCSERLPDDNREVLISLEWGIDIGTYERGEWRSEWINHYDDDNVLAWMPLPKSWKGADDE